MAALCIVGIQSVYATEEAEAALHKANQQIEILIEAERLKAQLADISERERLIVCVSLVSHVTRFVMLASLIGMTDRG